MKYEVFISPPKGFTATIEVSGCYCEWEDKILFLKRHPQKPQGNNWGLPAGKIEKGENPRKTVIREVYEEVGLHIDDTDLQAIGQLYCRLPHVDYIFHMFRKRFITLPIVELELEEHLEMRWVTVEEALKLPLISGGVEALHYYAKNTRCSLE